MTQNDRILAYLKLGYSLTGLEALELFQTMKISTRISEIRRDNPGLDIRDEFVHKNGKQFKKYWLHREKLEGDMFLSEPAVREHEMAKK